MDSAGAVALDLAGLPRTLARIAIPADPSTPPSSTWPVTGHWVVEGAAELLCSFTYTFAPGAREDKEGAGKDSEGAGEDSEGAGEDTEGAGKDEL